MESALKQEEEKCDAVTKATSSESTIDTYPQKLRELVVREKKDFNHEFDAFFRYMPTESLKNQPGKISVMHADSEYSYEFKAFGKLPLQLSAEAEYIGIDADGAVPLSLPSHLTGVTLGLQVTLPFLNFEKTYLRSRFVPYFNTENWNFDSSSFRTASQTFLIYQPNDKLTLIAGLAHYPRNETEFFPIAGFIYEASDKLVFNIVPSTPTIFYQLTDRLSIFAEAGFSGGEFKVNKDGYDGAIMQYNELHGGFGLGFKLNKYFDLYLSSGYMFNRYLKYRDSLGKVNLKNSIYTEFRLEAEL